MSQNQIRKTLSSLQVSKCPNTLKLYALKSLLTKNCFYFLFLIFRHANISPSFRTPRYRH